VNFFIYIIYLIGSIFSSLSNFDRKLKSCYTSYANDSVVKTQTPKRGRILLGVFLWVDVAF